MRKIIAVSDYVCFFCFIFYYQSIMGFNNTHSVLHAMNDSNLVTFEHPEILSFSVLLWMVHLQELLQMFLP